jgi:hypothetical protein
MKERIMPISTQQAESAVNRRKAALANFVMQKAKDARELAERLDSLAALIVKAEENADQIFGQAIEALENFDRNMGYGTAMQRAAEYASAEMELLHVAGAV